MTTQYMEEGGFKKKFLAPLVVIMLCAVALAGAAYAWSTSVHGNGNMPDPSYYSINLYSEANDTKPLDTNFTITDDSFVAYTTKTVGDYYHGCVDAKELKFILYVKVSTNKENQPTTINFTSIATYSNKCGDDSMYAEWGSTVKPTVMITNAGDDTTPESYSTGTFYKVTITVPLTKIDVSLGITTPADIDSKMKFTGTDCIYLELGAEPATV